MLKGLFGNRSVERILLFLLVNEKCYGSQIQNLLGVSLTPVQRALQRLEKEEVVISVYERKIRFYQLNPSYPLRRELEHLLKKAYTLLSAQEKRKFSLVQMPAPRDERDKRKELLAFWEILGSVRNLSFSAKTRAEDPPPIRLGKAAVSVETPHPNVLVFNEKGHWLVDNFPDTAFSNVFRWTLDAPKLLITLEHLRYGNSRPVFLFHLTPASSGRLDPVDAHLCGEDAYLGHIGWSRSQIRFDWRVIGPKKNDSLVYLYS